MSHWNEGYFSDFSYTQGYYETINPLLMNFNLALRGIKTNTINDRGGGDITPSPDFNYLELGIGMGVSVNIHAATTRGYYTGVDFNPTHMAYANTYAKSDNITLYNDSFKEFLARLEKEKITFDYICFHGIFSWISRENREILLEIIRRFLKVGGVVYNSYNCFPNQIFAQPIKEILFLHYQLNSSSSLNANDKIASSIDFLSEFAKIDSVFTKNPNIADFIQRIQGMKTSNLSYLAHEYLNAEWRSFYFYEVAKMMENVKCSFAVSAELLDHLDAWNLNEEAREFLGNIADPIFREQIRDYYVNRNFRGDIFIKGEQRFAYNTVMQKILNTEFVLISLITDFTTEMDTILGTLSLNKDLYAKALDYLQSQSYKPKSGLEIMQECEIDFSSLVTLIIVLIKQGMLFPTQKIDKTLKDRARTYNEILFDQQIQNEGNPYVASPLTGSCIQVSAVEQLIMKNYLEGVKGKEDLALKTFALLKKYDKRVIENGAPIENDEESIKNIQYFVKKFMEKLPIYKVLGILD